MADQEAVADAIAVAESAVASGTIGGAGARTLHATSSVAKRLLIRTQKRYAKRRFERLQALLDIAARFAQTNVDVLVSRLEASPARERVLIDALLAAQDEDDMTKVFALAESLALAANDGDGGALVRERAIVGALAHLDSPHLAVLRCFGAVPSEGGSPRSRAQLLETVPDGHEILDAVTATLAVHGLLMSNPAPQSEPTWGLTPFGALIASRVQAIDAALANAAR